MSPDELLSRLRPTRSLRFEARSEAATGWNGVGTGTVVVTEPGPGVVVFEEAGTWQPSHPGRPAITFGNVFRWTSVGTELRLEHHRFGADHPVLLFDLVPGEGGTWRHADPHQCREDCYTASLAIEGDRLVVSWSIVGPRKRESIRYTFS